MGRLPTVESIFIILIIIMIVRITISIPTMIITVSAIATILECRKSLPPEPQDPISPEPKLVQQDDAAARNRLGSGILSDDDEEEVPQDKVFSCSHFQALRRVHNWFEFEREKKSVIEA